jgi:hypothetical protein
VSRDFLLLKWIYTERASYRDPPPIFIKFLYCVVVQILNLKGFMRLMQKTYLFCLQIGEPLANASKIYRIYVYSSFPPTGKAGDVVLPYFGKSDIYCR